LNLPPNKIPGYATGKGHYIRIVDSRLQ